MGRVGECQDSVVFAILNPACHIMNRVSVRDLHKRYVMFIQSFVDCIVLDTILELETELESIESTYISLQHLFQSHYRPFPEYFLVL